MSFDAEAIHIGDIPFPSVTICNHNKVRKSKWENIKAELVNDPTNDDLIAEKEMAEQGIINVVEEISGNNKQLSNQSDRSPCMYSDVHQWEEISVDQ